MALTKEKKNRSIEFTVKNEIKLDPSTPIPIQYGGDSFYIVRGKKYVPFLGRPDNFPTLLLEARLTSPTQNACISSIAQSTIGNGLVVKQVETPNEEFFTWAASVNNEMQSLNEVCTNVIDGERTHGNQFIELVKGKVGKTAYLKVYTHPMSDCRLGEVNDKTGYPDSVIISPLFAKTGITRANLATATVIPLWSNNPLEQNTCWIKMEDGTERTMLHFKNEVSGIKYYGLPASISSLRNQIMEGKSVQYNIDNFDNNMVLGGMLILKSSMTEEEAQETAKKIMLSHIGEGKTGRIAVISSESGLDDVDFKPYDTQKEGSFLELSKRNEEVIITANGWDAILAGISHKGTLGTGSSYVRSIWDVKESILLNPLRKKLISKVIKPIAQIYAQVYGAKDVETYNWDFKSAMPFSFLGDVDPETFMKVNEARDLAGLTTDDTVKDKYLSEMKAKSDSGKSATKPADPAAQNGN